MKWTDLKDGVWDIPREPREKSNAGVLLLPQAAIDIIEARDQVAAIPLCSLVVSKVRPSIATRRARPNSTRSCQRHATWRCTICAGRHAR